MKSSILFVVLELLLIGGAWANDVVNDNSQLNPIRVNKVVVRSSIQEICELVRDHKGPISVGGGRYSQGGQIAIENALFLDMKRMDRILNLDVKARKITVESGTTWRKI